MLCGESLVRLLGGLPIASCADTFIPRSPQQWSALVDESLRQGVAPLLYRRLQALGTWVAPPVASIERLQIAYFHNALRQQTVRAELRRILLAFRREGIRVVLLKGAHLADVVYGDPALRPMVDIDLLVAPADLARVERTLTTVGYSTTACPAGDTDYTTHQHMHPFDKRGALPIEVHRGLTPIDAPFDVDLEGLWSRTRLVRVAGVEALVLSPEDLVHHLCVHVAYNHRFDVSLLSLYDIGAAVAYLRAEIDWRRLAATANLDGTSRFVYCALSLVQATFGTEIPAYALDTLDHAADDLGVVQAARDCLLTNGGVELPVAYRALRRVDGLAPTMQAIARAIWPSRDRMRDIYELPPRSRAVYAYYAIRPFDLLRRRGKVVGGMLLRAQYLRPTLAREERRRAIDGWIDRAPRAASAGATTL